MGFVLFNHKTNNDDKHIETKFILAHEVRMIINIMMIIVMIKINCETQRLKLSSTIFTCCCPSRMVTSPFYDVLGHTNHIFSESSWSKDIRTDITKCLIHKYTNTNTQIHKYSKLTVTVKTHHVAYF